jgi:hypothetical protein
MTTRGHANRGCAAAVAPGEGFDRDAMAFGALALSRWRCECELCAAIAGGPRRARAVLDEQGFTVDHFANVDTTAIYFGLRAAGEPLGPPRNRIWIAMECRRLLRAVGCWDDTDERSFVGGGSRWGPGPICRLLVGVPFDADLLRSKILALCTIDSRIDTAEGRRRCAK